jgi:hypothetical protein
LISSTASVAVISFLYPSLPPIDSKKYFDKISKQVKLDNSIANDEEIAGKAFSIFNELWNGEDGIRSVCVFVSGLSNERKVQLSLFDEKVEEEEKEDKLQEVIDDIRNKFGDSVIGFANEKNNK